MLKSILRICLVWGPMIGVLSLFFLWNFSSFFNSLWLNPRFYACFFGLLAGLMLLFEFAAMGRDRLLAQVVEPAKLARWHRRIGLLLPIPVTLHIILVQFGTHAPRPAGATPPGAWWGDLAVAGVTVLGAVLFFCVLFLAKRLSFRHWRPTHYGVFLALLLLFWHQIFYGRDFIAHPWFRWLWGALFFLVLLELVTAKFRKKKTVCSTTGETNRFNQSDRT